METANPSKITVQQTVAAPVEKVWTLWTTPEHITQWNQASEDWHTTRAENDVQTGGKFLSRMEAKDGSFGFDFEGEYDLVIPHQQIHYHMADGRTVDIRFESNGDQTHLTETFDADTQHSLDMQRDGWQAILNNFKKYAEGK